MKPESVDLALAICANYKIVPILGGIVLELDGSECAVKDLSERGDSINVLSNHLRVEYLERLKQNKHLLG